MHTGQNPSPAAREIVVGHLARGNELLATGRAEDALEASDLALEMDVRCAPAHLNRGRALLSLHRTVEALECYERALRIQPQMVEAWTNRGNVLLRLSRADDALMSYERALQLRPGFLNALNNRCQALLALRRPVDALAGIDQVLRVVPRDPKALIIRGTALLLLGRKSEMQEHLQQSLSLVPDQPDLLGALADAQMQNRQYEDAARSLTRLIEVAPDHDFARGTLCDVLLQLCQWDGLAALEEQTLSALRAGKRAASPFTLMALHSEPADQVACARLFVEREIPATLQRTALRVHRHERIRLAYLSPDLREHPVANQIVRLLETHDRSRFEVIAVALEKQDESGVARRIRAGCDRLFDVNHLGEAAIVKLLRDFEIDVAIDLSGHTFASRTGVLAQRAAPVQVNYLGFPGTTGTACHDYIIADRWVIPREHDIYYSERVVRLPYSYQPYDPRAEATQCSLTRKDAGLPENAFVFCSFNNRFKIHPRHFQVWMRILQRVPASVLWLAESTPGAMNNLRREAESHGVAPERLLFAKRVDSHDLHIARYQLADLCLDTLPFNAHATASDALWAGLPLLTCAGSTFAGRVAAGMLDSVGLPDLITADPKGYENKAVELAQPGSALSGMRERLVSGRATHPLFDIDRYRHSLESAYERMVAASIAGRAPSAFDVLD